MPSDLQYQASPYNNSSLRDGQISKFLLSSQGYIPLHYGYTPKHRFNLLEVKTRMSSKECTATQQEANHSKANQHESQREVFNMVPLF